MFALGGLPSIIQARIFSYLTVDDGEQFPGQLSCHHRGSMKKLLHGEDLISQMGNYFDFLSSNAKNSEGLWTSPYLDDWGLGLMVTYAMPCISNVDNRWETCWWRISGPYDCKFQMLHRFVWVQSVKIQRLHCPRGPLIIFICEWL